METVLVHVVGRIHYEVDGLGARDEPRPVEGWIPPSGVRDSRLPESNQASGTAVVIRPDFCPPGAKGAFTAGQQLVVRDILADAEGVVRWGGDDRRPYRACSISPCAPVTHVWRGSAKIRARNETPGAGAGVLADMSQPSRRRRAARYQ